MSVNQRIRQSYGFGQGIYDMSPTPIVAQRPPTALDQAQLGTEWLDQVDEAVYILVSVVANSANWVAVGQVAQDATAASPTATVTINSLVGEAEFTGFTTASSGTQAFVINDSFVNANSVITATITTFGTNTSLMVIRNIVPGAGTFTVNTINTGAQAVNGNIFISFRVYN